MSYFVYRALTPDERRIRLIHLLPRRTRTAPNTSPTHGLSSVGHPPPSELAVSCTISHVPLDQPPPYSALSYTWGDTTQKGSITVDGAPFAVTKSLEAALVHLTSDDEALTLWIDALCIDQDDEAEKTEQVAQMQQIYSRAASVITWLGPAADDSDAAMLWIQRYGSAAHGLGIGTTPDLQLRPLLQALGSGPGRLPSVRGLEEFLRDISAQLSSEASGVVTALSKLFARAYWSRVWVVQELVHGRRVQFLCGRMAVSEEQLHYALRLLRNFGQHQRFKLAQHPHHSTTAAALNTLNPINILKVRRAAGPFPLMYLIRTLWHFRATDSRDRIFALLSFATDAAAFGLVPDYRKSCAQVYLEATFSLVANGFLDILSLCCQEHTTMADLPSWVPDLSVSNNINNDRVPLQQRAMNRRGAVVPVTTVLQPRFGASGDLQGRCELTRTSPTRPLLLMQAKFVDRVERTGTAWEQQHGFQRWLRELRDFSTAAVEPDHLGPVWRTVVADQEVRQGSDKPRMTDAQLERVHAALAGLDLSTADAQQTLVSSGLGDYVYQLQDVARGRRPFCTSGGRLGIGPCEMEEGDLLYVLVGSQVPHILRRDDAHGRLRLVGEAYAHGIMDGEAMEGDPPVDVIAMC